MNLQDEAWKEVIENKPDWARFITKSEKGFFEYHETKPKIAGFFFRDWFSDGKQEGYYGDLFGEGIFDGVYVTPECLDLSTIQSGANFVQGGVINQPVKLTPILLAKGESGVVENPNDPPSKWRIKYP